MIGSHIGLLSKRQARMAKYAAAGMREATKLTVVARGTVHFISIRSFVRPCSLHPCRSASPQSRGRRLIVLPRMSYSNYLPIEW